MLKKLSEFKKMGETDRYKLLVIEALKILEAVPLRPDQYNAIISAIGALATIHEGREIIDAMSKVTEDVPPKLREIALIMQKLQSILDLNNNSRSSDKLRC